MLQISKIEFKTYMKSALKFRIIRNYDDYNEGMFDRLVL